MTAVDFTDQVVLVTGGGSGLGRSYALMLARYGAAVAVLDSGCLSVLKKFHLYGSFYTAQAADRQLRVFGGGRIVNTASNAGAFGIQTMANW